MVRLTRIYTKTGDKGQTSLGDGTRVKKSTDVIHLLGEIDELNACLGVAICYVEDSNLKVELEKLQNTLFDIGAVISVPGSNISTDTISGLEKAIDYYTEKQGPLTSFILPGGTKGSAYLHLARTIARRAERRIWDTIDEEGNTSVAMFLNRLSDLLFVYAREENNGNDILWRRRG